MDVYFIVAELELPAGVVGGWLESPTPLAKGREGPSVAQLLDGAEGDVQAQVVGDRFSLRACLIDAAYFAVSDALQACFAHAGKLGGRGAWYSGDHVSGKLGRFGDGAIPTSVAHLPEDVKRWVAQAGDLLTGALGGDATAVPVSKKAAKNTTAQRTVKKATEAQTPKKTPAKKTAAKKTPAKKAPAKKTPAKKTPAKKTPAKRTPAKKTPAKKTDAVRRSRRAS